MSERCSFTSEYIYDREDYNKLRKLFEEKGNDKYLCIAPPATWASTEYYVVHIKEGYTETRKKEKPEVHEMPIIAGKTGGLGPSSEICDEVAKVIKGVKTNFPVRFIITEDSHDGLYVLDKDADGVLSLSYIGKDTIEDNEVW